MSAVATRKMPTPEELMTRAVATTGLEDFGAPTFDEGLATFIDSLDADARLTPAGVEDHSAVLLRRLENRLAIEEWYRLHPEVAQQDLGDPLCITGLPRTGTSALATLLSLETSFRPMRLWEMDRPCPPPITHEEAFDPRRLKLFADLELMRRTAPDLAAMHMFEVDGTSEDVEIIGLEFKAQACTSPAFGYHSWWRECDMRPAYAYHRRVSKLLQSRRGPNRWLLKAPHYLFHLEAVLDAYPRAKFVVTHRDPVRTIPSWSSLITALYPAGWHEHFDPTDIGHRLAAHQEIGVRKMMAARERIGEEHFLDVNHREFAADALLVVERVYDFYGLTLDDALRQQMAAWCRDNSTGSRGPHHYTSEEFGLNDAELRAQFAFYTEAYDVPLDD